MLFLLVSFLSFGKEKTKGNELESRFEIEIISQTIPILLLPSPPPPPPPFVGTEKEKILFNDSIEEQKEKFKLRVDTTEFYLYLSDSLFIPKNELIKFASNTNYNGLSKKLFSKKLKGKSLNISKIDNQTKYKILPVNKWEEKNSKTFGYQGIASYSRIVFNKDYTQAFFYFEHYYDKACSSANFILVENQNGKWKIIKNKTVWIS